MMVSLTKLFEPIRIGQMEVSNRLVLLASSMGYSEKQRVGQRNMEFFAERARGGVGLIIVGIIFPNDVGAALNRSMGIHKDDFIPGLRELTRVVHNNGAKIAAQLGLRYEWRRDSTSSLEYIAASELSMPGIPSMRPLTREEIHQLTEEFGEGARRAREAGFDAVEFLAGAGYLISNFLSPYSNKRNDEYGGSLDNRMRFLLEIIAATKKKAGDNYPLLCRFSIDECVDGGLNLEESQRIAAILEEAGIHCITAQVGRHDSKVPLVQSSVPLGGWVHLAEGIKQVVSIPVIATYRFNDPLLAEEVVSQGKADLVGMSRALIADPELPNKAKEGRLDDIVPCITCSQCISKAYYHEPVACRVNPRAGRETEYTVSPTSQPKRVFIIGGGPAGLEATRVAAQRGHHITLFEKSSQLGGQLAVAVVPPFTEDLARYYGYLVKQVEKSGAEIRLGEAPTADFIVQSNPEVVIVATGAEYLIPDIPGVGRANVVTASEVLKDVKPVRAKVIIIGGGLTGCETAEFLAAIGKKVTIVEMMPHIGVDFPVSSRWVVLQRLRRAGVRIETKAKVMEIVDTGVRVSRDGATELLEGDTVVLTTGMTSQDSLSRELEGRIGGLYSIGDCVKPRNVGEAIEEAFNVARTI